MKCVDVLKKQVMIDAQKVIWIKGGAMKWICKFCGKETNNNDSLCDSCWEIEGRVSMMNEETLRKIMHSLGWKVEKVAK